jgi:rod shape-determining protein MreD
MKALILILILLAFLQSTILPINVVLVVLVIRAYIKTNANNLYLAFGIGMLVSLLTNVSLGIDSFIYLVFVELTHLLSKSAFSKNVLTVIPLIFIELGIYHLITAFITHQTFFIWSNLIIETLISMPVYIGLRFFEDRFLIRKEVKLRV